MIVDSHAKGAQYSGQAHAVQLRALAAITWHDRAAFVVGMLRLQLTARTYLVEVREISRLGRDGDE